MAVRLLVLAGVLPAAMAMLSEGRLPARPRAPSALPRSAAYRNADMLGGQEPFQPPVLVGVSKQAAMDELKRKLDQARADLNEIAADFDALAQSHDVEMLTAELAELQAEAAAAPLPMAIALDAVAPSVAVARPTPVAVAPRPVVDHFTAPIPETRAPAATGLPPISVRIVGVGGSGGNTINRLAPHVAPYGAEHMRTIAINTDAQVLSSSAANDALLISAPADPAAKRSRVGQGAGGNPSVGALAASSHAQAIGAALAGADMVFVTGGMGGGTGSGAAPEVARLAREAGALTVGVVTRPFGFEGTRRAENANGAIAALAEHTDALVVISNDRLLSQLPDGTSVEAAFAAADDVLRQAICAVAEIVLDTGLVNVDFNDLRAVMKGSGPSLVGIGHAPGSAAEAARRAIECPLLETAAMEAKGIVFNVCGGRALSLREVHSAADAISEIVHPDANIIFGASIDESLGENVRVTVIATSIGEKLRDAPNAATAQALSTAAAAAAAAPLRPFNNNGAAARAAQAQAAALTDAADADAPQGRIGIATAFQRMSPFKARGPRSTINLALEWGPSDPR